MLENMRWLPVRCCCTPKKIFGFLQVPDNRYPLTKVRTRTGEHVEIEIKPISLGARFSPEYIDEYPDQISIKNEFAIYSDDRPIEFWRQIDGFLEVANQS